MASLAHPNAYAGIAARLPAQANSAGKSFWRRLFSVVMESQQRQAQREIDRVVSWRNGVFNDDLERRIGDRMVHGSWPR